MTVLQGLPWLRIFLAAYVVWVVAACASLLGGRRSPTATLSWIFAFIAVPFVSGLYYVFFGPRRLKRRRRRYGLTRDTLASGVSDYLRASSGAGRPKLPETAAAICEVGHRLGQGRPTFARSVDFLDDGDACFAALGRAVEGARHHVHMEYYIWEPDRVGTRMRDLLAAAARRGVEVRVLQDAMGSSGASAKFWQPLRDAGGEVWVFNPVRLSLASFHFANFRTHRKILVADGSVGFLGGINIHEPESVTHSGKDAWRDAHLRIEGEPVRRLQRLFLENWIYSGGGFSLTAETVPSYFPRVSEAASVPVQILASGPDDETASIHAFFLAALSTARVRAWIETPYLVPDEPLESALRIAALRGVDVRVLVPKRGDSRLVTAASHTYCESLRRSGVDVHQFGPPMLHAKTMVVDETVAVVGTANLDNRSFRLNFEAVAACYDPAFIARLAARFEEDRALSVPYPRPRRGARLDTFLESIARLASPIL